VDAAHFRRRAAEARAIATLGQDTTLYHLLLEVAQDLDAEADAIEAGVGRDRRSNSRLPIRGFSVKLHLAPQLGEPAPLALRDMSRSGARLTGKAGVSAGASVVLEITAIEARLKARVTRIEPDSIALAFDADEDTVNEAERVLQQFAACDRALMAAECG
jgi:hypothetical protein